MRGYTNRELTAWDGLDYADYVDAVFNEKQGTTGVSLTGIKNGSDPVYNPTKAAEFFEKAQDYKYAENFLNTCWYQLGHQAFLENDFETSRAYFSNIENILEPYAEKSYQKHIDKYISLGISKEKAEEESLKDVKYEFMQGFQGLEYKFNSVSSSRGDYPFITVTAGTMKCTTQLEMDSSTSITNGASSC